jgi:hypothetical protein
VCVVKYLLCLPQVPVVSQHVGAPTLMALSVMPVLHVRLLEGSMMGCRPNKPVLSLCLCDPVVLRRGGEATSSRKDLELGMTTERNTIALQQVVPSSIFTMTHNCMRTPCLHQPGRADALPASLSDMPCSAA